MRPIKELFRRRPPPEPPIIKTPIRIYSNKEDWLAIAVGADHFINAQVLYINFDIPFSKFENTRRQINDWVESQLLMNFDDVETFKAVFTLLGKLEIKPAKIIMRCNSFDEISQKFLKYAIDNSIDAGFVSFDHPPSTTSLRYFVERFLDGFPTPDISFEWAPEYVINIGELLKETKVIFQDTKIDASPHRKPCCERTLSHVQGKRQETSTLSVIHSYCSRKRDCRHPMMYGEERFELKFAVIR